MTDTLEAGGSISSLDYRPYPDYKVVQSCRPQSTYQPSTEKFVSSTTSGDAYKAWKIDIPCRPAWSYAPPPTPYVPGDKHVSTYKETFQEHPQLERVHKILPHSEGVYITDDSPFSARSQYSSDFEANTGKPLRRTKSFRIRDVYKAPTEKLECRTSYDSSYKGVKSLPATPVYKKANMESEDMMNGGTPADAVHSARRVVHKELFPASLNKEKRRTVEQIPEANEETCTANGQQNTEDKDNSQQSVLDKKAGSKHTREHNVVKEDTVDSGKTTIFKRVFSRKADARANSPLVQIEKQKKRDEVKKQRKPKTPEPSSGVETAKSSPATQKATRSSTATQQTTRSSTATQQTTRSSTAMQQTTKKQPPKLKKKPTIKQTSTNDDTASTVQESTSTMNESATSTVKESTTSTVRGSDENNTTTVTTTTIRSYSTHQ